MAASGTVGRPRPFSPVRLARALLSGAGSAELAEPTALRPHYGLGTGVASFSRLLHRLASTGELGAVRRGREQGGRQEEPTLVGARASLPQSLEEPESCSQSADVVVYGLQAVLDIATRQVEQGVVAHPHPLPIERYIDKVLLAALIDGEDI